MTRSRRSLLASGVSVLVGLAGCVAGNDDGGGNGGTSTTTSTDPTTPASTTTTTPTTTTTDPDPPRLEFGAAGSVDGLAVTPTGAGVQCSLFYLTTADQMGVIDPDGKRLLFVDVDVEGGGPDPSAFVLEAGGETYPASTQFSGQRAYSLAPESRRGEEYRTDDPTGWVGFTVPAGIAADEPRLRLDREGSPAWSLPAEQAATLRGGEPTFAVRSVDVPDTAADADAIPLSVTVENTGAGPGTFRFVVNHRGPTYAPARQRVDLSAGETRTYETDLDPYGTNPGDSVRLAVTTAAEEWEYTVEIEGGE